MGGLVQAVQEHLGQPCTYTASGPSHCTCMDPPGHPPPRVTAAAAADHLGMLEPQHSCSGIASGSLPADMLIVTDPQPGSRAKTASLAGATRTWPHDVAMVIGGSPTSASLARPSEVISTLALLRSKCATLVLRVCRYASAWLSPRVTCLPLQHPGLVSALQPALVSAPGRYLADLVHTSVPSAERSHKACAGCCRDPGGFHVRAQPRMRVVEAAAMRLPSRSVQQSGW